MSKSPVEQQDEIVVTAVIERIRLTPFGVGNPLEMAFSAAGRYVAENVLGNGEPWNAEATFVFDGNVYSVSGRRAGDE